MFDGVYLGIIDSAYSPSLRSYNDFSGGYRYANSFFMMDVNTFEKYQVYLYDEDTLEMYTPKTFCDEDLSKVLASSIPPCDISPYSEFIPVLDIIFVNIDDKLILRNNIDYKTSLMKVKYNNNIVNGISYIDLFMEFKNLGEKNILYLRRVGTAFSANNKVFTPSGILSKNFEIIFNKTSSVNFPMFSLSIKGFPMILIFKDSTFYVQGLTQPLDPSNLVVKNNYSELWSLKQFFMQ